MEIINQFIKVKVENEMQLLEVRSILAEIDNYLNNQLITKNN